jgi:hypothetical protein
MKGGLQVRREFRRWELKAEGTLGLLGIAENNNWGGLGKIICSLLAKG